VGGSGGGTVGLGGAVGERSQASGRIPEEPPVDGPSVDPVAAGHIGDGGTGIEGLSHGQVALLNHRKLHKHPLILLGLG
jgi:hypothetical protein